MITGAVTSFRTIVAVAELSVVSLARSLVAVAVAVFTAEPQSAGTVGLVTCTFLLPAAARLPKLQLKL